MADDFTARVVVRASREGAGLYRGRNEVAVRCVLPLRTRFLTQKTTTSFYLGKQEAVL